MKEMRNTYRLFDRKPEEKRSLGTPRHRWEHNLKLDIWILKVCYEDVDWIQLLQDRVQWRSVANAVMNLRVQ
jgi:hypothetical protein